MSTIIQEKRATKQIRVSSINHRKLKFEAIDKGQTISKFADSIIENYFDSKESQKENEQEHRESETLPSL